MSTSGIPNTTDKLPALDKKMELFRLDAEPIMKHVTPGFGMFISRFTDDMLVYFFKNKEIDKYQKNVPSHYRYLYLIRAVWKTLLTAGKRAEWEKIAIEEPHFEQLKENKPEVFDCYLKRGIDRKLYEQSEAFLDAEDRRNLYKQHFQTIYGIDIDTHSDSPFEKTVNLSINVDYSATITSPHSIQLLKVFLNLEQFVNVLLEYDKNKAVELLRQTVNYIPQQTDYLRLTLQKLLPKSSSQDLNMVESYIRTTTISAKTGEEKLDYQQLAFYPLLILEKLLCKFSPDQVGVQRATEFRDQALDLGVMDFVLECLSHFTHQRCTSRKLRSWRMPLAQFSVSFSSALPSKKIEPTTTKQNESTDCVDRTKTYFAKGTGYGSGDTKQVWDLKNSEQKIRFDDNNIACLLNILRAFIQPPIHDQVASTSARDTDEHKMEETNRRRTRSQNRNLTISKKAEKSAPNYSSISASANRIPVKEEFLKLLRRSCLKSVIKSVLMSGSLLEINKNISTYHAVFQLLVALSNSPSIEIDLCDFFANQDEADDKSDENDDFEEDATLKNCQRNNERILPFDVIFSKEDKNVLISERDEIIASLQQFSTTFDEYLRRVAPELAKQSKKVEPGYFDFFAFFGFGSGQKEEKDKLTEDKQLQQQQELSNICKEVVSIFKKQDVTELKFKQKLKVKNSTDSSEACSSQNAASSKSSPESLTDGEKYCNELKEYKFVTISFENIPYHYSTQLNTGGTASAADSRFKRIAREIYSLRSGLMLTPSTSAFVLSSEQHLDALKVLITGPVDTPYSNGCFEFDFFFPSAFPANPPQVCLKTTGNGSVRFNPNLYNCGKVCLSILGTWPGRPEEQWNSDTSSILQVITSIQSLILVNDPYFNEPGYERSINTPQGNLASKRYNSDIQIATVRWAMLEQLKRPPRGFENVIRHHFSLKQEEIRSQITNWITEWRDKSQDSRCASTADELEKLLKLLNEEFKKLQKSSRR